MKTAADLYLRLSDARLEEALDGREAKLRTEAARLGWDVHRVVIENDRTEDGHIKPASAYKRRKVITPSGRTELRTFRPGFRSMLEDITAGAAHAILAEDLDRACRDPRDLEDIIDACALRKASARSLSGSLTLTDGGTDTEITTARIMVTVKNQESRDKSRRVAEKRETLAGQSYQGGRRPFGYKPDPAAEKYHKTLHIVDGEAEVLRAAARTILDHDTSLRAIAAELRERGVPTVTGTRWTAETLRGVLLKPAVAGLASYRGQLRPAPWDAIIPRDQWEQLRDKLTDPSRRTNKGTANAPKWLLSGIAHCGICGDGTSLHVTGGRDRSPAYVCDQRSHLRRAARQADEYIATLVIARLSRPDAADLLKPPLRRGIDAGKLRAEARKLRERKASQMRMHAEGLVDDADLAAGLRVIRDKMAAIDAQLAVTDTPDPLEEFRNRPAEVVWESLPLSRKRDVVKLLITVTFLPMGRKGRGFDPDSLKVEPNV